MSETHDTSRRRFLSAAAGLTVLSLAPGVVLYSHAAAKQAAHGKRAVRWGMLIDVNRCAPDCDACVSACATEFGLPYPPKEPTDPQWIRKISVTDPDGGHTLSFPVMCQHCSDPPCVEVCPTGASFKRDDGIVLIDRHLCVGCRYCEMACPYKARSFVSAPVKNQKPYAPRGVGTSEACTLCVHRIDAGRIPACVEACAATGHSAMLFGDLNDPESEIAKRVANYQTTQIRADLRTDPGIRYEGL